MCNSRFFGGIDEIPCSFLPCVSFWPFAVHVGSLFVGALLDSLKEVAFRLGQDSVPS